ncbi:MAG: tripartite tricarboxylate transporter substrate binding protein [Burkholderiales bacterium]|nr:tripartite tricarboxylate transporter substrate binding protein [Burkholderiales bacterium]
MRVRKLVRFISCVALLAPWYAPGAYAQTPYPNRPIRLLVPFPAGGAADLAARTVGERLTAQTGQPVVIDNRPGAGGRLAAEMLARAEPDGYTLFAAVSGAITISPSLYKKLHYDVERDLMAITRFAEIINVAVAHPSANAGSVRDLIAWAKAHGKDIRFGSSGVGQPDHLSGELFSRLTGLRMLHVPYKGGGPALIDLIAGDLQMMFPTYIVALPHFKSGRLRVLAVTTPQRQPLLPDLPSVAETVPGFNVSNWTGLFAPARTPSAVVAKLLAEVNQAIRDAEAVKRMRGGGLEPGASESTSEFAKFIRDETLRWAKIIKDANITVD